MRDTAQQRSNGAADPLDGFDAFARAVRKRLAAGRESYHDESFARPPSELLGEVAEELLDVCGWAYVTWHRVQQLAMKADEARQRMLAPEVEL
jgi:hypothetical protein